MTLARRFCADESDAAELVNRTFAAVVDGIDDYLEQSAFFGWMCQILSNIHAKDTRNKSNGLVVYPGDVPDMADEAAKDAIFHGIDRSLLREAVNGLPKDQRESIVLHYFLDIPIPMIAKILAVPGGTVKSRLHYARLALAAKLGVAAKQPGAKALLVALALAALTAAGAATSLAVARLLSPPATAPEQQEYNSTDAAAQEQPADDSTDAAAQEQPADDSGQDVPSDGLAPPATDSLLPFDLQPFLFSNPSLQGENMNVTTRTSALCAVSALALAASAPANTIALWPMELDPDSGTFYGTNAIGTAHGLSLVNGSSDVGPNWALPSNPDASAMAFSPLNGGTAIASGTNARYTMEATGSFGDRVTNTKEWTAEGWINISATQTASWMIILQGGGGSGGGNGGWMLRWQGNEGARYFCLTVANDSSGKNGYDSKIGPQALSSTFENSFVGSWHHIALTHKLENGKSVWRLYIDGNNEIDGTAAMVEKSQSGS